MTVHLLTADTDISPTACTEYTTALNNRKSSFVYFLPCYWLWPPIDLQAEGRNHLLSWAESCSGPSHEIEWTVTCKSTYVDKGWDLRFSDDIKVGGEVKGTGTATQKAAAKEAASKQALEVRLKDYQLTCSNNRWFRNRYPPGHI